MVALLATLRVPVAAAQAEPAPDTTFHPVRFAVITGTTAGAFIVGHGFLNTLWWKGSRVPFHFNFQEDWTYALGADKFGHFFFPYLVTDVYRDLFLWTGIDSVTALYAGASLGLAYQTYVEVRDGFSAQYGFSFGDFGADVLGALYPIAQYHWPVLRNFNWKMSFQPSDKYRAGDYNAIIDDYESSYYWLSINVHNLLPEKWRGAYPAWINLALGHSVKNIFPDPAQGHHELYLALDWNLDGIHTDIGWLRTVLHYLNYYHLPSPAVRIYPDVAWWGMKF